MCSASSLPLLPGPSLRGTQEEQVTVPAPGATGAQTSQEPNSREPREAGLVPMSEWCRKATAGLQSPVIGVNFFKSTPKTSDTEIS